jgi:long-chain acyl-CoA synthetase
VTARTLDDDLRAAAAARPDHVAIVAGERRMTYAELDRAAGALAGALHSLGVERGDRVALVLPNGIEAAIAIYGTLRAGAAFTPLNPTIKRAKLAYVLNDCGAVAVICDGRLAPLVQDARSGAPSVRHVIATGEPRDDALSLDALLDASVAAAPAPAAGVADTDAAAPAAQSPLSVDLAAIVYTSGSTGPPKGVTLTHANMTFAAGSIVEYLGMNADDRILCVVPLSFDYGLYQLLMSVRGGATLILERGFAFPGRVVELLERERITGLPGVPTIFQVLTSLSGLAERELPDLRFLTNTAAALPAATIAALRATFPHARLYSMYGLTECKRVSYLPPEQLDARPESVGIAIPGTEVWIEDDEGKPAAPGEVGELIVRGAHVMQGYWNDPEATAQRLRPGRWPWERVLATGDLFRADEDGYLYFVGRRDDIIKSRGEKVSPKEVENVLYALPGIREAAVVGTPDPILGMAIKAVVALEQGSDLTEQNIIRHCAKHLEDFMVPKIVEFRDELPKTDSGKISRRLVGVLEAAE